MYIIIMEAGDILIIILLIIGVQELGEVIILHLIIILLVAGVGESL